MLTTPSHTHNGKSNIPLSLPSTTRSPPLPSQAQTPQQRRANEAYAKSEAAKRGKPVSDIKKKQKVDKAPISPIWVCTWSLPFLDLYGCTGLTLGWRTDVLIFAICGGLVVEVMRIILRYFS